MGLKSHAREELGMIAVKTRKGDLQRKRRVYSGYFRCQTSYPSVFYVMYHSICRFNGSGFRLWVFWSNRMEAHMSLRADKRELVLNHGLT
jgi:hypothetical protein